MFSMPILLNLVLPGAGLICLKREWLGFSLSLLFGVCGNVWLAGWLIAPVAIPQVIWWLAVVLTLAIWLLAQILFWREWTTCHDIDLCDSHATNVRTTPSLPESTGHVS